MLEKAKQYFPEDGKKDQDEVKGVRRETRKGYEETSGVMSVFTILSGMMVSQVYPYVKTTLYTLDIHFRYHYLQLIM